MRVLNFSVILAACFMLNGCTLWKEWTKNPSSAEQAYKAGKVATIAYLSQKDKLEEDQKKAIVLVYEAFDALMNEPAVTNPDGSVTTADLTNLKELIIKNLKGKLNNVQTAIVIEIIDIYVKKLKSDIHDKNKLIGKDALLVLKAFHRGTKDALKDYKLILQ